MLPMALRNNQVKIEIGRKSNVLLPLGLFIHIIIPVEAGTQLD